MDEILTKASNQAVSFAIRSGITLASGYAIKTVSRLLDKMPESEKSPLFSSKAKLDTKLRSVMEVVSLIKLDNGSRNSILAPTVELIKNLEEEIDIFNHRMKAVMETTSSVASKDSIAIIKEELTTLHLSLNEIVPYLNLALNASSLCNKGLKGLTSISNLLIASSYLLQLDTSSSFENVGPTFDFRFFSVFYNSSRMKFVDGASEQAATALTWKEEFARCRVQLIRSRIESGDFHYLLDVTENFDDDRYHAEESPQRKQYQVESFVRQFFSGSGKLLRLESSDSPILVIKVKKVSQVFDYIAFSQFDLGYAELTDSEADSDSEANSDSEADSQSQESESNSNAPFKDAEESGQDSDLTDRTINSSVSLATFHYLTMMAAIEQIERKPIRDVKDEKLLKLLTSGSVQPSQSNRQLERNRVEKSQQSLDLESSTRRMKDLSIGGVDSGKTLRNVIRK